MKLGMFTINKNAKNLSMALMAIGLISIIISFYFSNSNQYSDEEINSAMIDIVEKPFFEEVGKIDVIKDIEKILTFCFDNRPRRNICYFFC